MQPKTLWDKTLCHMSIQSKFQPSRASESKRVTWKPFSIVADPQFTERLKQLWVLTAVMYSSWFEYPRTGPVAMGNNCLSSNDKNIRNICRAIFDFKEIGLFLDSNYIFWRILTRWRSTEEEIGSYLFSEGVQETKSK